MSEIKEMQVRKHVGAIHVHSISKKLGRWHRLTINAFLYNAYDELPDKSVEEHFMSYKRHKDLIGYEGTNNVFLKQKTRELKSIEIEWNILDQNKGQPEDGDETEDEIELTASSILAEVSFSKKGIYYSFPPRLRKVFHAPSMYSWISLYWEKRIPTNNGLILYETCVRFRNLPCTGWISVEDLRKLFDVEEGRYPAFKSFNQFILKPAIQVVNENTDIELTSEGKREGRSITHIRFHIQNKKPEQLQLMTGMPHAVPEEEKQQHSELFERLLSFGLTRTQASKAIKNLDEDHITENLDIVEAHVKAGKEIDTVAGYTWSALFTDYRPKKTKVEVEIEEKQAEKKKQQRAAKVAREATEQKQKEEETRKEREENQRLDGVFAGLSNQDQQEINQQAERRFIAGLSTGMTEKYDALRKQGTDINEMPIGIKSLFLYQRREAVKLLAQEPQT